MPRLPLVLLLAAVVAGCDSAGLVPPVDAPPAGAPPTGAPPTDAPPTEAPEPSALVGTWALTDYDVVASITSQIDQIIALPSEGGNQAIRTTGAETLAFKHVGSVMVPADSGAVPGYSLYLVTSLTWPENEGVTEQTHLLLYVGQHAGQTTSHLIELKRRSTTYRLELSPSDPPFEVRDGVLTVPERELTAPDGSTVTVGGAIAFPTAALVAGQATEVPLSGPRTYFRTPYFTAITYAEDGTLRAVAGEGLASDTLRGTWAEVAPDRVRHTYTFNHGSYVQEYTVAVENGALSMRTTAPRGTSGSAFWIVEGSYLAEPGSFHDFWYPQTYRLAPAESL